MMNLISNNEVSFGDIVQINPNDKIYGNCFMFVKEIRNWGVIGYVQIPEKGKIHIKKTWDEIEWCGQSVYH